MKYLILVCDGMADFPLKQLGNQTPMEAARTPFMDQLAAGGKVGLTRTIPDGFKPASDVGNMAVLGYDPHEYYCGRGPLEAANIGVDLKEHDVAFRCNLVTADGDTMADYSAGHIKTQEASELIQAVDRAIGNERFRFYPGVQYRHLMVVRDPALSQDLMDTQCAAPHDIMGQKIASHMPKGPAGDYLTQIMDQASEVLARHPVNQVRVDLKENPANRVWFWGQGRRIPLSTFEERFGLTGSVISAVDLVKGLGRLVGLNVLEVPGATGYYDTNYVGKAQAALKTLKDNPFVFVHVEAADEAGHNGHLREKVQAIENFDKLIVGTIMEGLKTSKSVRILILPDHITSVEARTHKPGPVPFLVCGKDVTPHGVKTYTERAAEEGELFVENAYDLLPQLVNTKTW